MLAARTAASRAGKGPPLLAERCSFKGSYADSICLDIIVPRFDVLLSHGLVIPLPIFHVRLIVMYIGRDDNTQFAVVHSTESPELSDST